MSFRQGARQFFERRGAPTPPLPYDAEVEYLESTGTQYVDTGVNSSYDLDVEMEFVVSQFSGEQRIFGQSVADVYRFGYTSSLVFFSSGSDKNWSHAVAQGDTIHLRMNGKSFYVNGDYVGDAVQGGTRGNYSCYIFAWNRSALIYGNMKFRYCTIKSISQNVTLRDFIPVRVGSGASAVGYMYDRVSGTLFGNAGTGAFTIGPDKTSWTNPYVTDGLVAMWDGEWNEGGGVHDANATSWIDLVGGVLYSIPNGMTNDGKAYRSNYCSPTRLNLPSLTSFTIEFCLKLNAFSANDSRIMVSNEGVWSFFATVSGGGLFSCAASNGSDASFTYSGDARYIARTCSCTVGIDTSVYCDGTQKGKTVSYLPRIPTYYKFPGSAAVDISLYCFRIYNHALTAAEIAANYAIDQARFNLP